MNTFLQAIRYLVVGGISIKLLTYWPHIVYKDLNYSSPFVIRLGNPVLQELNNMLAFSKISFKA